MPGLPEVEITARRLGEVVAEVVAGARVESALAPGVNTMRSFDPSLAALEGRALSGVRRRGKHLIVAVEGLRAPRPLHALLRDQRVIAGIGRSWVDEILHAARLSPFKRGEDLSEEQAQRSRPSSTRITSCPTARPARPVGGCSRTAASRGCSSRRKEDHPMIQPGEQAPDFTLPDQDGTPVTLSSLRGRPVVLYFYPKADTPGCTVQACGVRDHRADYEAAGAVVLGVSPDPVAKVKRFHDKHGLDFTLLADEDHAVAERYGVWVEKSMYGRRYWGVQRATFIIDEQGDVARGFPKVRPETHDEEVLKALAAEAPGGRRR